ncbi:MAG: glycoside hydrolase family 25 protein [Roseburia sp.]|nr:glycoside hydrolase family 25 protein [Roseburia sp.]
MRLPEDYEKQRSDFTPTVVSAIVAVTIFVGMILVAVLLLNNRESGNSGARKEQNASVPSLESPIISESRYPDTDSIVSGSKLSPDDLDFWDKYPEKEEEEPVLEETKESETEALVEEDPATDGKHTLVKYADGSEEWVLISPYLPKHEYDFTSLVCQSGLMKYYVEGKQVSFVGTDISKYQDYVDFVKLKKAGMDFVMLRAGARGYSTGQLVVDDYFLDNLKRATDADLKVGVYFFSQAVTEDEAVEEARLVLDYVMDYNITYPIAFDMEYIENDTSRIDILSKTEKTAIAKKFLDTVKDEGYIPMLYGNKEWLIKQVDLSKLTAYDIWFSQQADIPDYPYQFAMWQYSTTATIDGIAGYANLNVSFIDYTEK